MFQNQLIYKNRSLEMALNSSTAASTYNYDFNQ